ncbi:hypothetical protein QYH53_08770 [Ligilactobacillus animalis]|uniref:hypothetical protein n=1 Tax=Ligilactobacillus animalis TaxID=1605 RepID=UPI00264A3C60|nr:hypothetical protein [Ligilactobacillus animalis]WKB74269.1 hypothetical protein QYH53_08770 [Ligilactobacillus animalis]
MKRRKIILMIIFILGAVFASYPAFCTHYFKATFDGQIHLIKFEAVTEALKHFTLPQLVNFMGYQNVGEAFNGMYPWLSGLIFIIPRLFISEPLYALFAGFVLLNLITMVNTYLLTRHLTTNVYWRLLGVTVYEFNAYHMTVMYGRNAFGEMLAYAFLPLIFLGYMQILDQKSKGIWALGIGMGMVMNSHVISALFSVIILVVIEGVRICFCKTTIKEIIRMVYAGIVAILISCYTLGNMLLLMTKNNLITPWKALLPIIPDQMWDSMLTNNMSDKTANSWNMGLVAFVIFIALIIQLFKADKVGEWKCWIIGALVLYFLTLSWIPYPEILATTFLGNIQFLGRLLSFIIIFIVIGMCQYLEKYGMSLTPKPCLMIASVLLIAMSASGVKNFHDAIGDDDVRYYLNNENYLSELEHGKYGWYDYMISAPGKEKRWLFDLNSDDIPKRYEIKATYGSLAFKVNAEQVGRLKLPFLLYNGVQYNISVNGHKVSDFNDGQVLTIMVNKGQNSVKISSEVPKFNYITFGLTMVALIVGYIMLFVTNLRGDWIWQKDYQL